MPKLIDSIIEARTARAELDDSLWIIYAAIAQRKGAAASKLVKTKEAKIKIERIAALLMQAMKEADALAEQLDPAFKNIAVVRDGN